MQNVLEKLRWTTCFYTHPPYPLYKTNLFLYSFLGGGEVLMGPPGGCEKVGVADFGVFFGAPLGIPSDLHGHFSG